MNWIRINIRWSSLLYLFIVIVLLGGGGCSKPLGKFAFKYPGDKGYTVNPRRYEFDCNKKLLWIYTFDNLSDKLDLGIVIMKKELFWVEVMARRDYVNPGKRVVYGTMENYPPGDYRIIILERGEEKSRTIDECSIYLFSDSDS